MAAPDSADSAPPSSGLAAPINEPQALCWLRQTEDASRRYYAAWWLGRMRSGHPEAVPLLLQALRERGPAASGVTAEPNPVARNAARALGKLGDHRAVPGLLEALEDPDDGLREAAARSLGALRAVQARGPLLRRLASGPSVAGAQRPTSSRLAEPCEAMLEALGDLGMVDLDDPGSLLAVIRPYADHERPVIRSAACRSLLQLTGESCWGERLVGLLQHEQLQVRRAALLDLGATGWRQAAPAIAATLAENSLKLIALRGLVEESPERDCCDATPVAAEVELLDTMDRLL